MDATQRQTPDTQTGAPDAPRKEGWNAALDAVTSYVGQRPASEIDFSRMINQLRQESPSVSKPVIELATYAQQLIQAWDQYHGPTDERLVSFVSQLKTALGHFESMHGSIQSLPSPEGASQT